MATKIRYNVHTTNKYSVFDTDNSEEENENNKLESKKEENNITIEKIIDSNSEEIKKLNEIKIETSLPLNKESNTKKSLNHQTSERYKYPITSLNDVNDSSYRSYRDNYHPRGNIRNKFQRKRGGGYNNLSPNVIGTNNFYRSSRNYDYKINNERRNYNSSYNYNKFDYREKVFNEYNDNAYKYDNTKRENIIDIKNKNYDENVKTRKHESVTINYDMYKKQQEKKLNSNKNVESVDKRKKKNEIIIEKSNKVNNNNNTKKNETEEDNKVEHPKRKAINVYQYILEEGGRVDRLPGFRRNFRNFRKGDDANWNNKNEKVKASIDENIFKKRDPPNINDTRAFPSLSSK